MMPFFRMLSPERFNDLKLGTLTILKRNKSYMSTIYPNAAIKTGIRKSCCIMVSEDESVTAIADESFIIVASLFIYHVKNLLIREWFMIILPFHCSTYQFIHFAICF